VEPARPPKGEEMTIEEIEGLAKKYNDIFPNSNESKMFNFLLSEVKRLREGISEVIDGTLPYLAEKRLKELLERK